MLVPFSRKCPNHFFRWHFLPEVPCSRRCGVDTEQFPQLWFPVAEAKAKGKAKAKAKAKAAAAKPKAKAKAPARGVIKAALKADPKAKPKAGPALLQRDLPRCKTILVQIPIATFRQAIAAKEFADVAAKLKKTKSKDSNGM